MAQKNNIRSIRFSDELAELIDRQVGDTFTQKFENLITRCVWELPQKEKQLADTRQESTGNGSDCMTSKKLPNNCAYLLS